MQTNTTDKIAIIGAGPSGLAAARALQKKGIAFQGFEMGVDVGGLWNINNPRSTVYESAHLISSKRTTEFKEFPMSDEMADYPSQKQLLKYFQDYADKFGLKPFFRFNTQVEKVAPDAEGKGWWISITNEAPALYKGLIIASGTLSEPNIPKFKGQETFKGEILHASKYKTPDIFKNKRVLIVGAGNSGCDIAVDAVHYADMVDMSVRRGYYFIPKYVFGKPADTNKGLPLPRRAKQWLDAKVLGLVGGGDGTQFGFPKPDYKLYESHPIVNTLILTHLGQGDIHIRKDIQRLSEKTVYFKDNSSREYDLILTATGYKLYYPFIDKKFLDWTGFSPDLYLNIFPRGYDNLFVLGMIEATGIGWEGRAEQGELVAAYIKGLEAKTTAALAFQKLKKGKNPDMTGGYSYLGLERMSYYVHKDTYRGILQQRIKQLM